MVKAMDEKRRFQDLLGQLVELAADNGNLLEKETVDAQFQELGLSQTLYQPIYDYLKNHKITVAGVHDHDAQDDILKDTYDMPEDFDITKEEAAFLDMYYADLKKLPVYDTETLQTALSKLQAGQADKDCIGKLTEAQLSLVVATARTYTNRGVSLGDLIQEGNLAVMQAIPAYTGVPALSAFQDYVRQTAAAAMQSAINVQTGADRISTHLADQANYLDEASRNLSKELKREPTLEELAQYTHLDESEVHNIMKYSLDALNSPDL